MEEKKEEKVGSRIRIKNLICQKKNLKRKSKMTILGLDDQGLR